MNVFVDAGGRVVPATVHFWSLVLQKYGLTGLWMQIEFGEQGDGKRNMQFEIIGALLV